MAELLCLELSSKPVKAHLPAWMEATKQLLYAGENERVMLLLHTILQAQDDCVEAHVLLVHTMLSLGAAYWTRALQGARHAVAICCRCGNSSPVEQARVWLALGLALGSVARMTLVPQAERSAYRSEARGVLQQSAHVPGNHRISSLYALAVIDAEGGHYNDAVQHAQQALEAAEHASADAALTAPIVALLALLLSARQQVTAALSVLDAGLSSISSEQRCQSGSTGSKHSVPRCSDVLLLRIKAQLLLAMARANEALSALGTAKQHVSAARKALAGQQDAAAAALRSLNQEEAQVWRELALAYVSQQQPSDAQPCVQKMQQLEPNSAATHHALGAVAAACKDTVRAKQAYKTALAVDATYAPALLSLGTLLRRQGDAHDLSVAVGLLTDALRYEPHNHVGWFNLGMACKAQGHIEEAEKHLFTAVTLAAAAPVLSYSELPLDTWHTGCS